MSRPLRALHRDESGQVSLLLVFMILVLATLIFFVFNAGDQANQAVMAQNSADSAALAGANWLAHGFNTLSMNNVAASKIIALIAMLEAIGPAVEQSLPNARAILPVIEHYPERLPGRAQHDDHPDAILTRALTGPVHPSDCDNQGTEVACECLADECRKSIEKLEELEQILLRLDSQYADRGGFPAALTTFEDGELWQILRALQTFSNIVVELTPALAQQRAGVVGRGNWATNAVLIPVLPDFPVRAGQWRDYHDPVMSGLPPDWDLPSAEIIKGGYHTHLLHRMGGYWPPYERIAAVVAGSTTGHDTEEEGEDGDERRGNWENRRRTWIPSSILNWVDAQWTRAAIMNSAKGPYRTYRDDIVGGTWPEMRLSGFPIIFERMTHSTMQAIWNNVITNVQIPRWETDWWEIVRPPSRNDPGGLLARGINCAMRAWLGTRRNARQPFGGPDGTPSGQPWRIDPWPSPPKNDEVGRGWWDHDKGTRQTEWVWWSQNLVRTFDPAKFGATPNQFPPDGYDPPGTDGRPRGAPYWLFYRWKKWLFLGALMDTDRYDMQNLERLVGDKRAYFPYVLDPRGGYAQRHDLGKYDVLAFAWRPGWARMWGRALKNPTPLTAPVDGRSQSVNLAYAQVRVFNPTAWDLWTQDWRVKLVPAGHLSQADMSDERLNADVERYREFDTSLEMSHLEPLRQLQLRMPRDAAMLDEITNH